MAMPPRIVFATVIMRAAFSADLELVKLLFEYDADPHIKSSDNACDHHGSQSPPGGTPGR